ncbi:MAG: glycosyltransferase family A protein [Mycoplasmoidaceae bacterium]
MDQNNILFSIVIPFYDTIDYIKETIESIISQQHFNLDQAEVIIVDDGSKQNLDFLLQYKSSIKNLFIHTKENGNWGSVINYVKNNKLVKGKYVTILDSDDRFANNILFTVQKYLHKEPDIITAKFYRWKSVSQRKKLIPVHWLLNDRFYSGSSFIKKQHLLRTPYSFPLAKFYKTDLFYKSNFVLEEHISFQDSVFFHTMVSNATSWQYIDEGLALYRDDRPNSSSNTQWSINRINAWIKTINNLDKCGATSNAYMYCIFKPFVNACKQINVQDLKETITLHNDFNVTYICKPLQPIAKLVFKKITKKLAKTLPIKFV